MRRRIIVLALSVTSLVVVAFVIPLALLVRRQADQSARVAAENDSQTVAAVVVRAVAASGGAVSADELERSLGPLPDHVAVVLADEVLGTLDPNPALVSQASEARTALSTYRPDGDWELALPVITREEPVIVFARVPAADLDAGVTGAWILLAAMGVGLIAGAVLLADRLGRTVVAPSERLAAAAHRLGQGDLGIRVPEEGPEELVTVAEAFNLLAARIRDLLAAERESVADLSHRLRTPLTAVRLQAEQISEAGQRTALLSQVDRLQHTIDELITEARRRPEEGVSLTDVAAIVTDRAAFWRVLAEEQGREMEVELPGRRLVVAVPPAELAAALDALIGNVFTHTDPETGFRVAVTEHEGSVVVAVADSGRGFATGRDPAERGSSGAGSTGLGLDIARRLAERTGGRLRLGESVDGGARVEMIFGRPSASQGLQ